MAVTRIAAAAAHFGRDIEHSLARIGKIIADARAAAVAAVESAHPATLRA